MIRIFLIVVAAGLVILGAAVVFFGGLSAQPDAAPGGEGAAERQVPEPLSGPPRRGVPGDAGRRTRRGAQHAAGVSGRSGRFRRVRRRARPAAGAVRCGTAAGLHGGPAARRASPPARRRGGCRRCGSSIGSCCAKVVRADDPTTLLDAPRLPQDAAEIPERAGGRGAAGCSEAHARAAGRSGAGGAGDPLRHRTARVGTAGIAAPRVGRAMPRCC